MAVDSSKPGASTSLGAGAPTNGNTTNAAVAALAKRKRPSSLMKAASELPTVEHSLEEFIAKANQTLVDASTWAEADQKAREEEARRREQDAQRWKQAELQMRESEAREASLRRQLDGLQGKLAEAEARAAVAMSASSSGAMAVANETALSDLKAQLEQSQQRLRAAEEQTRRLTSDLESARLEAGAPRASAVSAGEASDAGADERIRIAEMKAVKALAAARAAAAGLTVSPADLAAIESGITVSAPAPQKSPWPLVAIAFLGGIAVMFVVWKLALSKDPAPAAAQAPPAAAPPAQTAPAVQPPPAQPAPQEPAAAPAPAPAQPTVTPIDEQGKPTPTVTPIDEQAGRPEPQAQPKPEPEPKPAARPEPKPAAKPPARPARPRPPAKPPEKPPGGIVDPF